MQHCIYHSFVISHQKRYNSLSLPKSLKLSSRANFNEQTQPTFSGADIFLSRRRQSITLDKDPKLAISQPKQPFAVASQTPSTANSNFFIPASPSNTATGFKMASVITKNKIYIVLKDKCIYRTIFV